MNGLPSGLFSGLELGGFDPELTLIQAARRLIEAVRRLEPPRSIAELRLSAEDIEWLSVWARGLRPSFVRDYCTHTGFTVKFGEPKVRYSAAFGLMLLTFASECARRDGGEKSLWPSVRRDARGRARFAPDVDDALFNSNNYPVEYYRKSLRRAARTFQLRHAFDETEGKHRYYRTLHLQYGFSCQDFRNLKHWLVGQNQPMAVESLRGGDQASRSFQVFWNQLRRARRMGAEGLKRSLADSPWTCPGAVDNLIRAALVERPSRREDDREALLGAKVPLLAKPKFTWTLPDPPQFTTRLVGLSNLDLSDPEYELRIAGSRVLDLFEDEEGQHTPNEEGPIQLPGHSTSVTAELVNANGEVVWTDILECRDPTSVLAVYRLASGARMPEDGVFDPECAYALLVSRDFAVRPQRTYQAIPDSCLVAHWIEPGQIRELCVTKDGLPFWQPMFPGCAPRSESEWTGRITAEIQPSGMTAPAGDPPRMQLIVRHPNEVTVHDSRILDRDFPGKPRSNGTFFRPFRAPVEMLTYPADSESASGTIDVVLRIEGPASEFKIVRKRVSFNHHGAAVRRLNRWETIPADGLPTLTVDEAARLLFHVVPEHRETAPDRPFAKSYIPLAEWKLVEMDRIVGTVQRRASVVRGLHGYGGPLLARCGRSHHATPLPLAQSVIDPGFVREVGLTSSEDAEGNQVRTGRVSLDRAIEIEPARHRVLWWDRSGRWVWVDPTPVILDDSSRRDDWWEFTLPGWAGDPRAVAIAYGGVRLGSWWSLDWADALDELDTDESARLIRWLKLPILGPQYRPSVDRFIDRQFGVWLLEPPPSDEFPQGDDALPWRDVVRCLYHTRPVSHSQAERLLSGPCATTGADGVWFSLVGRLCDIHPLLLANVMNGLVRNAPAATRQHALALIRYVISEMPAPPPPSPEAQESEDNQPPALAGLALEAARKREHTDDTLSASVDAMLEKSPQSRYALGLEILKTIASQIE